MIDKRIEGILTMICELARGNFSMRIKHTQNNDDVDAVIVGLNMLAEEFAAREASRKDLQEVIETSSRLHEDLYEHAADIFICVDLSDFSIMKSNQALTDITGHERTELLNMTIYDIFGEDQREQTQHGIAQFAEHGYLKEYEMILPIVTGEHIDVSISATPIYNDHNHLIAMQMILHDISQHVMLDQQFENKLRSEVNKRTNALQLANRQLQQEIERCKLMEARLQEIAQHDILTGLPNRLQFETSLDREIARAKRHQHFFALLLIDLDYFKDVNDTYGHPFGDELLCHAGDRLKESLRSEDFVARLGGDEFIVILNEIESYQDASFVAQHLLDSLNQPYLIEDTQLHISASIGIAFYPEDGDNSTTLVKHADIAMYRAKDLGRNGYQTYHTPESYA